MLFVVILVLMIVFIIIFRPKPYQSNNQQEIKRIRNHSDGSWREDNYDGTFKIHDKKGTITVTRTYEGERYVDGHRVNNSDDMARWSVLKSLADGYWSRLLEIERLLEKNNTDDGDDLLKEWNQRYQKLRQLCIDNKLWNGLIGDRSPFIPTTSQLAKEAEIKEHIIKLHDNWKSRMIENRIVLDYLEKCPRKHALKSVMLSDLSGKDPENKKKIQAIYRRLKSSGIIGEKENKEGKIEARIIVRRSKNDQPAKSLPASTYHSSIYENVRRYDIYKVDYTVGDPERLDRSMNTCQFTSKTSGENYLTSLEQCTCPAYIKGRACKHMLALAIQLGYYKRSYAQPYYKEMFSMGLLKWLFGRKKEEESFHPDYSKEDVDAIKAETSRTAPKISLQATQKKHNMSLNKYEVKAVYKATNRSRTRTIYAKNEDDVKAQMVDYNDPDSIKEIPYDPPSQRQLAFASELKIHIPSVCCKEDMTALISEALRKEHQEFSGKPWKRVPPGQELLRFADSKHIPYSLYAEEFTVIRDCYMLHLKDDKQRVAFMIACMYRHINGGWNFCKWDQWLKDAEDLLADGSFYKSLVNNIGLDDGFQGFDYHDTISSRTKLYQMIADKAK